MTKEEKLRRELERFASKPDDALASAKVSAAYLDCSERFLRYHPAAKRIYISPNRYAFKVGNIREIARGAMTRTNEAA